MSASSSDSIEGLGRLLALAASLSTTGLNEEEIRDFFPKPCPVPMPPKFDDPLDALLAQAKLIDHQ